MRKIVMWVAGLLVGAGMFFATTNVAMAAAKGKNCVQTTLWGEVCEDETGSGIYKVLQSVVDVLTAGVGVAAVIGVIIAGIQYMTAAGNEAQMAKSKSRIIQIVIGLLLWALMWAGLQWLIPGGPF